jgi:hypothetical protein
MTSVMDYQRTVEDARQVSELVEGPIPFFKPRENNKKGENPHPFLIVRPNYFNGPTATTIPAIGAQVYDRGFKGGVFPARLKPSAFGLPDPIPGIRDSLRKLGREDDADNIKESTTYWSLVVDLDPVEADLPILAIWQYNAYDASRINGLVTHKFQSVGRAPFWGWDSCPAYLLDRYKNKGKHQKDIEFHPAPLKSAKDWILEAGGSESYYAAVKKRADEFDLCRFLVVETEETLTDLFLNFEQDDKDFKALAKERRDVRDEALKAQGKFPYAPSFLSRNNAPPPPPPPPPPPVRVTSEEQAALLD